jgi:hypothetical protein
MKLFSSYNELKRDILRMKNTPENRAEHLMSLLK